MRRIAVLPAVLLQAISGGLQNGVPAAVAKVVVSQGATALPPVSPDIVRRVQDVSDLMHQIGSPPTEVDAAGVVDTSAYATAATPGE